MSKIIKLVAEISKKSSTHTTEWMCRGFMHQPKVPTKLLVLKNEK